MTSNVNSARKLSSLLIDKVSAVTVKQRYYLFVFALTLFTLCTVFSSTIDIGDFLTQKHTLSFGNFSIQKGLAAYFKASVLFILFFKIAIDVFDNKKLSLCQLIILSLVVVQGLISHSRGLLFLYVFALAARDVDIKTISRIIFWALAFSISIVALLSLSGFIQDINEPCGQWYRPVRRSLGFTNQNILAQYVLALIYSCFVLLKPKLKAFLVILLITMTFFFISGSRALVLGVFVLYVSFYVFRNTRPEVRNYLLFLFPLIAILDLLFLYQFSFGPIESWLDRLSSHRFSYICPVLQEATLTFFGTETFFTKVYVPFDNSYAWCLLIYGMIGTAVFLSSVFLGMFKNSGNVKLLALCSSICIVGLVESRMSFPVISFPLIKILLDGWDISITKGRT